MKGGLLIRLVTSFRVQRGYDFSTILLFREVRQKGWKLRSSLKKAPSTNDIYWFSTFFEEKKSTCLLNNQAIGRSNTKEFGRKKYLALR